MMFGWLGIGGGGAADEVRPFVWELIDRKTVDQSLLWTGIELR